jgi:ubiquinone/menaquinone biosynthesis C-methylase UbiE
MAFNIEEAEIQRRYYAENASRYDDMHVHEHDAHYFALTWMLAAIDYFEINSILDIGSGTGRVVAFIKEKRPGINVLGVEPIRELREIGYGRGISQNELIDGNATNLQFSHDEFDLVCEFGVLHHIKIPDTAVSEMLRVAKKAIFLSDSNNFGQGSFLVRSIKQTIDLFGLWKIADLIKTRGKGYIISEGDGLSYSYSVFNSYKKIKQRCKQIHLLNTQGGNINPYRTASHVALLGIKK